MKLLGGANLGLFRGGGQTLIYTPSNFTNPDPLLLHTVDNSCGP